MVSVLASHGGAGKEITIREDAPEGLRFAVLETPRELGWGPSALRDNRLPCVERPARFRQLERGCHGRRERQARLLDEPAPVCYDPFPPTD